MFTDDEELEFVYFLDGLAKRKVSINRVNATKLARSYFDLPKDWYGYHWIQSLVKKYPNMLSLGKVKVVKEKRIRIDIVKRVC